MQPWQNPVRWVRVNNWWAKIPPLLAVIYAEALLRHAASELVVRQLTGLLLAIFSVAAYGHVINDLFDLEADRQAGKPNAMSRLGPFTRGVALVVPLVSGWLPWLWTGWGLGPALLLAVNYALPTCYSIPPVRLKERGPAGVLADASGAHGIPTLFIVAAWSGQGTCDPAQAFWLGLMATASAMAAGLRGILQHQLYDRLADLRAGVSTLATQLSPERLSRYLKSGVYPFEIVAAAGYVWAVQRFAPAMAAVFVVFALVEVVRVALDWQFRFQPDQSEQERYRPLSNNAFYELWWPAGLVANLVWREPGLAPLALVQVAAFWRGYLAEGFDLAALARSSGAEFQRRWNRVWWDRRIRVWHPRVWGEFAVRLVPFDENGAGLSLQPGPMPPGRRTTLDDALELSRQPFNVVAGQTYRLSFLARAEQPTKIDFGVSEAQSPWTGLGLARSVTIGTGWRMYLATFVASNSSRRGRAFLLFPGLTVPAEVRELELSENREAHPWFVVHDPAGRAQQLTGSVAGNARWLVSGTGEVNDDVVLRQTGYHVARPGEDSHPVWRLRLEIWTERGGEVVAAVKQGQAPWDNLGLEASWRLAPGWQTVEADWTPTADDPQACLEIACGRLSGEWELVKPILDRTPSDFPWLLDAEQGHQGAVRRLADPSVRRLEPLPGPDSQPTSVRWTSPPLVLSANNVYRLTGRARALGRRTLGVDLVADREPWPNLGLSAVWRLTEAWEDFLLELAPGSDIDGARLRVLAGESAIPVELADWRWIDRPRAPWWSLDARAGAMATLHPDKRDDGCRVEIHDLTPEPSDLSLLCRGLLLSSDEWLRLGFVGRADAPRRAVIRICHDEPPWDELAPSCEIELDTVAREWVIPFPGPGQPTAARVQLVLGNSAIPCRFAEVTCRPLPAGEGWSLESTNEARAQRLTTASSPACDRIELLSPGDRPEQVRLTRPLGSVRAGIWYRLRLRARADRARPILVRLCEAAAPWGLVAAEQTWHVTSEWQTFVADLPAESDETSVRCHLCLGGSDSAIEIAELTWQEIALDQTAILSCDLGYAAQLSESPRDPERWLVSNLGDKAGLAEAIRLTFSGYAVRSRETVRLTLPAGATQASSLLVRPSAGDGSGTLVGPEQFVLLEPTCRNLVADFEVTADDRAARVVLALGAGLGEYEVARPRLEDCPVEQAWRLECAPGQTASRQYQPLGPLPWRLVLSAPAGGDEAVRLVRDGVCLEAGQRYLFRWSVVAERERPVVVRLCLPDDPWPLAAPELHFTVGPDRRELFAEFTASATTYTGRMHLCWGGSAVAGEFADPVLTLLPTASAWSLRTSGGRRAQFEGAFSATAVRVRAWGATDEESGAELVWAPLKVEADQPQRLTCQVSGSGATDVTVVVKEPGPPWQVYVPPQDVPLSGTPTKMASDLWPTSSGDQAELVWELPPGLDWLEVSAPEFRPLAPEEQWRLSTTDQARARRVIEPSDPPATIRIEIGEAGVDLYDLAVAGPPRGVRAGQLYELRGRWRAAGPRDVTMALVDAAPPWTGLGLWQSWRVEPEWQTLVAYFRAEQDCPQARLQVLLGGDATDVEWQGLELAPLDRAPWRLDALEGARAQLTAPKGYESHPAAIGVANVDPGTERWHVQLEVIRLAVQAGRGYRVRLRVRSLGSVVPGCLLAQAQEPWQTLAEYCEWPLGAEWQSLEGEFIATADEPEARFVLLLGGHPGRFELAEVSVSEFAPQPPKADPERLAGDETKRGSDKRRLR